MFNHIGMSILTSTSNNTYTKNHVIMIVVYLWTWKQTAVVHIYMHTQLHMDSSKLILEIICKDFCMS